MAGRAQHPGTTFTPWLSLSPATAILQNPAGPLSSTCADWKLGYIITYAGLSRKQTEALADRMRNNLIYLEREDIDTPTGGWKMQKISCNAIGNTNRIGSAYPDYFTQADTFEVWVTKGTWDGHNRVKITKDGQEAYCMPAAVQGLGAQWLDACR